MAQIDTGIYNMIGRGVKSVSDYQAEDQQRQQNTLALQTGQQNLLIGRQKADEYTRGLADDAAYRDAAKNFGADPTANYTALLQRGLPKQAMDYQKAALGNTETIGKIGETKAKTDKTSLETAIAKQSHIAQLAGTATDQASWDRARQLAGFIGADVSQIPEQFDPKTAQQLADTAMTRHQQLQQHLAETQAAETTRHNTATEGLTARGQNMTDSRARDTNAATIAKDFKIAGLDPATGNFAGGSGAVDGLVDAIGQGKVPQGVALSRTPPAMKAQILARVAEKYPEYDPTDMAQRNRAAVAFGTGKEGNSVRSFNVALSHLDTLSNLSDALGNGNMQIINRIGNAYAQQTGSAAPTNFESAKKIVTDEIVKAIVGSGGGVHDRQAAADTISKASSPAQLKGVISSYKELMNGQLGGLERQYKATTGRDDFRSKFLSPEANAESGGVNSDLHSKADAILKGK